MERCKNLCVLNCVYGTRNCSPYPYYCTGSVNAVELLIRLIFMMSDAEAEK